MRSRLVFFNMRPPAKAGGRELSCNRSILLPMSTGDSIRGGIEYVSLKLSSKGIDAQDLLRITLMITLNERACYGIVVVGWLKSLGRGVWRERGEANIFRS